MKMSPAGKIGIALIVWVFALAVFGTAFVYSQVMKAKSDEDGTPGIVRTDYPGGAKEDRDPNNGS